MKIESTTGNLDLSGTQITALPDNLTVGGLLNLSGTQITGAVYNCGYTGRAIHPYRNNGRIVISLGCFIGTEDEAIQAISIKYSGQAKDDYIAKVHLAFQQFKSKQI